MQLSVVGLRGLLAAIRATQHTRASIAQRQASRPIMRSYCGKMSANTKNAAMHCTRWRTAFMSRSRMSCSPLLQNHVEVVLRLGGETRSPGGAAACDRALY